jgi:3-deoxy-D-manno-octulosonic acid kinase
MSSGDHMLGFAHSSASAWLENLLREGTRLRDWATAQDGSLAFTGRGAVLAVRAPAGGPDRRERWAIRQYRRGGAAARLLGDRYARVGEARPVLELGASVEARARGVPTPTVVAGAMYPAGLFYRADLATELIPDATALADVVFGPPARSDVSGPLRSVGRLVRLLEEARMLHADLNARNVLVGNGADAWVVDLDGCRTLDAHAPPPRVAMRARLERSLRKLCGAHGRALSPHEWEALRSGFEETP